MVKHGLRKLLVVALSMFSFMSFAHATNVTISYGNHDQLVPVNRDAGVTGAFNFTDIFDLDVTVPASFKFLITELEEPVYNIVNSSFSYGLYDVSNNLVTTPTILTPGSYQLRVSGTADGLLGGQYFLSTSVATPVPEPDLSAFMLFGLSMIGFVILRKSRS